MSQDLLQTSFTSLFLVFTAGLLSFLSPCVLPLIPSYIGILGGIGLGEEDRPRLIRAAVGFVLGFSAVFIVFGILVSTTFFLTGDVSKYITWAAGIIVIVLGLNVIFDFLSFLNYEKRPFLQGQMAKLIAPGIRGIPAAFFAGAAFGTGWTPCVGPILTAILLLAGQGGKTGTAVFYLSVYSAGLAIPFILAALFFNSFLKHGEGLRSHLPLIRCISGILLVVIGVMILLGRYSALNGLIQKQVSGYIVWAETRAFPFRLLANALAWIQSF
jgi:cytochrome c-type biogenesis protein